MKPSHYNHYIKRGEHYIFYNAFSNSFLLLSKEAYSLFNAYHEHIQELENQDQALFQTLKKNGFIVDDEKDEVTIYMNQLFQRRFSKKTYHMIINPTMDCNLSCWYCYEHHISDSSMNENIINAIIKNIQLNYDENRFSKLIISFFGGEPFLKFSIVKNILEGVKMISEENDFSLVVTFTTNATIIKDEHITFLKKFHPEFQITLDGNREEHNKTRFLSSRKESYSLIISNIKRIVDTIPTCRINLRINFSKKSLKGIDSIIDDLYGVRENITITPNKIWQVRIDHEDENKIISFIDYARKKSFVVDYLDLRYREFSCYADNQNQAVINYDGSVFKCTARDFNTSNAEGKLLDSGKIQWNVPKILTRMGLQLPTLCKSCKILPVCHKICSQKLIEKGDGISCGLNNHFSVEDYIIHNFNKEIARLKNKNHVYA